MERLKIRGNVFQRGMGVINADASIVLNRARGNSADLCINLLLMYSPRRHTMITMA
jgi:hypothetical protein